MFRQKGVFLSLSFLLHAALAAFFLLSDADLWKSEAKVVREVVEFELQTKTKSDSPQTHARPHQKKAKQNVPFQKLLPAYDLTKTREPFLGPLPRIDQDPDTARANLRREGPMSDPGYDPHGEQGVYGYSDAMGLEKATETMPFFQALWGRVDQVMDFPVEIAEMRIGGQVVVHLKVNPQGQMVGDFLQLKADHPVLLTYALVVLSQALRTPLNERTQLPPDHPEIPVVMVFDFQVVTLHALDARRGGYFKNSLEFSRTRYMDPYATELIEYAFANYVPPVIVYPGGVYIDFIRAYQMIDNYANDRPDLYDKRDRKFRMLRDQLDLAIIRDEAAKAKLDAKARR